MDINEFSSNVKKIIEIDQFILDKERNRMTARNRVSSYSNSFLFTIFCAPGIPVFLTVLCLVFICFLFKIAIPLIMGTLFLLGTFLLTGIYCLLILYSLYTKYKHKYMMNKKNKMILYVKKSGALDKNLYDKIIKNLENFNVEELNFVDSLCVYYKNMFIAENKRIAEEERINKEKELLNEKERIEKKKERLEIVKKEEQKEKTRLDLIDNIRNKNKIIEMKTH